MSEAQRRYDNESDDPPKPKRPTLAEADVESSSPFRRCRGCGKWAHGLNERNLCEQCDEELSQ